MNPKDFGTIISTSKIENGILYVIQDSKGNTITFSKFDNYNEVVFTKNRISLIKFRDELISENKFVRIIENKKYYFENNQQILFTKEIKTKFIQPISKSANTINKFITLDIETFVDSDNNITPYLISYYDGKFNYSFSILLLFCIYLKLSSLF
jgi:hypothetical protein